MLGHLCGLEYTARTLLAIVVTTVRCISSRAHHVLLRWLSSAKRWTKSRPWCRAQWSSHPDLTPWSHHGHLIQISHHVLLRWLSSAKRWTKSRPWCRAQWSSHPDLTPWSHYGHLIQISHHVLLRWLSSAKRWTKSRPCCRAQWRSSEPGRTAKAWSLTRWPCR